MNGSRAIVFALLVLAFASAASFVVAGDVGDESTASFAIDDEQMEDAPVENDDNEDEDRTTFVVADGDTAEHLALPPDEIDTAGFERGELDVAAAVGQDAGELRAEYFAADLDRRTDAAATVDERQAALRSVAESVDRRAAVLQTREQSAVVAYAAADPGGVEGEELFRTFAIVDAEAEALLDVVRTLHEANAETDDGPLTDRELATYRSELEPLSGPVRERVGAAATGSEPVDVYLEVSDANVVLTTLDGNGDRFVREAHLRDLRQIDAEDRLGFTGAEERFEELYPWVVENNAGFNIFVVGGQPYLHHADVYVVSAAHVHGFRSPDDLTTYIDGGTRDVFYETQHQDPEAATVRSATEVDEELELHVEWVRGGWPVSVEVVDLETGEPVDAEIAFDDDVVGTTDGQRLWTLAERGTITVEATYQDRSASVDVVLR